MSKPSLPIPGESREVNPIFDLNRLKTEEEKLEEANDTTDYESVDQSTVVELDPILVEPEGSKLGGLGNNYSPPSEEDNKPWYRSTAVHWGETIWRGSGSGSMAPLEKVEELAKRLQELRGLDLDLVSWRANRELSPKTKKLHWQIYLQFRQKCKACKRLEQLFVGRFRPCQNYKTWRDYCTKAETAVEGPYGWDEGDTTLWKDVEKSDYKKSEKQTQREAGKSFEQKVEREIEREAVKEAARECYKKVAHLVKWDLSSSYPTPQEQWDLSHLNNSNKMIEEMKATNAAFLAATGGKSLTRLCLRTKKTENQTENGAQDAAQASSNVTMSFELASPKYKVMLPLPSE